MIRARVVALAMLGAAAGLAMPGAARACYIPELKRLPDETDDAYVAREIRLADQGWLEDQALYRDRASTIALVRVTRLEPIQSRAYGHTTMARVRQVTLLKGPSLGGSFYVKPDGTMFCGSNADELARSWPGATFLLFMKPGRPGSATLIKAVRYDRITDPDLKAALARKR